MATAFERNGTTGAAYDDYPAGASAPISAAGRVRLRNNAGVLEASQNGAAYAPLGGNVTQMVPGFDANTAIYPATSPAGATSRNVHPVITFDDTTAENVLLQGYLSNNYRSTSSLLVNIDWIAATAVAGAVVWGVEFEVDAPGGHDLDADSFAAQVTATSTTNATSGVITRTTITLTNAQADAIAAGQFFRCRLQRVAASGSDTMVGDAQVVGVNMVQ